MYLVDTSVWIHALRPSGNAEIQARLKPLIIEGQTSVTEWILLELMTGLVKSEQPSSLLQWFTPVPRLAFNQEWWETAWDLAGRLRRQGGVSLSSGLSDRHDRNKAPGYLDSLRYRLRDDENDSPLTNPRLDAVPSCILSKEGGGV